MQFSPLAYGNAEPEERPAIHGPKRQARRASSSAADRTAKPEGRKKVSENSPRREPFGIGRDRFLSPARRQKIAHGMSRVAPARSTGKPRQGRKTWPSARTPIHGSKLRTALPPAYGHRLPSLAPAGTHSVVYFLHTRHLLGAPAAVHQHVRPGDEARGLRTQVNRELAHFFDLPPPPERNPRSEELMQLRIL